MANVLTLTDGSATYNLLTATDYRIRYGGIATPPPEFEATMTGNRFVDGENPAFTWHGNRQIDLMLMVEGTSVDDLLDNFKNAQLMLERSALYFTSGGTQGAKATLTVKLDGATNTSVFEVKHGHLDSGNWATKWTTVKFKLVEGAACRLTCAPFAVESAVVTSTNNNQANSGISITQSSVRGDVNDFPLKITISPDQAHSLNLHLWAARRTRGTPANFIHKMEGEVAAYTGYTTSDIKDAARLSYAAQAAVGTASNDAFGRWTYLATAGHQVVLRCAITANYADNYGAFRVWVRFKNASATASHVLQLKYGTVTSPTTALSTVTVQADATVWAMADLGVINWPDVQVPAGVAVSTLVFELYHTFASSGGTASLDVDYFLIVPVDESYIDLDVGSVAAAAGDIIVIDGTSLPPSIYATDSGGSLKSALTAALNAGRTGSFPKMAPGTSRWLFYCDENDIGSAGDILADTADIVMSFTPPYHLMRGS